MNARGLLAGAILLAGCSGPGLGSLPAPRVTGSLQAFKVTYDGSTDPGRCVATGSSLSADEDGQAMTAEPGRVAQQCVGEGPLGSCGQSEAACLPPSFTLAGTVDDAASSTIHLRDGADTWTITVQRGGTVELLGAPSDGGPLQVGDSVLVRCTPAAGAVLGAHLEFVEAGVVQRVTTTDLTVDGGQVSFTLAQGQFLDDQTRDVRIVCDVAYVPSICQGPTACELGGPLRGGTVPMFFPQL